MQTCLSCGVSYPQGKKFCRNCGTALSQAPKAPAPDEPAEIECPACHRSSPHRSTFCRYCGHELSAVTRDTAAGAAAHDMSSSGPSAPTGSHADAPVGAMRSTAQRPRNVQASNRGAARALAIAATVLLVAAGWYFGASLPFVGALLPDDPARSGPGEQLLASQIRAQLPGHVRLGSWHVEASENVGDRVEPIFKSRFRATVVLAEDTFEEASVEDGALIIVRHLKQGAQRDIGGLATSRLSAGTWKTEFVIDDNPIPALGRPQASFAGGRALVRGSAEETAFREQQLRQRRETEERLQARQLEEQLAQQRLDQARQEAERIRLESKAEAERQRIEAARRTEATRLAELEAERRREEEQRHAREATEAAARQKQELELARQVQIPQGTELNVRLTTTLDSGRVKVEERFEATTAEDWRVDRRMGVPAGSLLRGVVSSVQPATRRNRKARMILSFDQLTVNGRAYPIRASVTQVIEGRGVKGEVGRTSAGAAVGAVIGAILGGGKGAAAGAAVGAGGTLAATEGREIELKAGTILRVRFDSPVLVR